MTNREQRARDVLHHTIAERDTTGASQTRVVREGRCDVGAAIDAMLAFSDAERSAQPEAPEGWVMVPREPTDEQWGGLARAIMMWLDMAPKTPRALFRHLDQCGHEIPQWLRDEPEMKALDHVPSKGTRCVILYRAMLAAAPTPAQGAPASDVLREALDEACTLIQEAKGIAGPGSVTDHLDFAESWLEKIHPDFAALTTSAPQRDELVEALERIEPLVSQLALPSRLDPYHSREIRELGERIGYGALMHGASALWRVHLEENGGSGGEFVVGPCAATVDKAWTRLRHDIEEAKR